MIYNVVPIRNNYRGIDRSLLATDLYNSSNKSTYNDFLNLYYKYISVMEQDYLETNFSWIISFYKTLEKSGVVCEVIVYDYCPLTTAYSYNLEFLGIDIVCDMAESLLCNCSEYIMQQLLNKHGLCRSLSDVEAVMPLLNQGNAQWQPCYVYSVNLGNA